MLIGIDATSANKKERTGVEWYAYHLISELKKIDLGEHQVVLYSRKPLVDDLSPLPEGWRSQVLRWSLPGWNTIRLAWEMLRAAPEVLFVPGYKIPWVHPKRSIVTIHDLGADRIPDLYEPKERARLKKSTKQSVARASQIITVSEFSKNELVDVHQVPREKIRFTPLAADTTVFTKVDQASMRRVREKYRLGKHYFFHVGRLEAKKNVATLIRAFEIFKRNRGVGDAWQLVLAGQPGFKYQTEIKPYLEQSPVKDSIRELGYVPQADLPAMLCGASAYLFPSWYEGFGIPAVEAMACATPLIASAIPPLKEVAGPAAVYVAPNDPEEWAHQMGRLANEPDHRAMLIEAGEVRAQDYSWSETAKKTWQALTSEKV